MNRWSRGAVCAALLTAALPPLAQAACTANIPLTRPDSRYVNHGDGTVTDTTTGLMWKQCSEGQSGADCSIGSAATFTWQAALQRAADVNAGNAGEKLGHNDWRLPNLKELKSLLDTACYSAAINTALFPGTPPSAFWSSSPSASISHYVWAVDFNYGDDYWSIKDGTGRVRLVRGGQ
jgi:hypothetical protein